jgi:hypothetical protein
MKRKNGKSFSVKQVIFVLFILVGDYEGDLDELEEEIFE